MTRGSLNATQQMMVLPRHLIPSALMIHSGSGVPQHLAELESSRVVASGRLHPLATSILETMTNPEHVATVELTPALKPPSLTTVWSCGEAAVIGELHEPELFALHLVDRHLLTFDVAQVVGVGNRQTASLVGSIEVPGSLIAASKPHWHDGEALRRILVDGGIAHDAAMALALAHAARRATWRVTVLRMDTASPARDAEVVVLDGDAGGYWNLEGTPSGDAIVFTPLSWDDVIARLGDLFPPR